MANFRFLKKIIIFVAQMRWRLTNNITQVSDLDFEVEFIV